MGSSPARVHARITSARIDVQGLRNFASAPGHGAIVVFEGVVRDHDHGRSVRELEYQAHPDAQQFLERTCAQIAAEHAGAVIAAEHRHGLLAIGEPAFVVAVGSAHRDLAFAVCADVVTRVKAELPIWKRQVFDDGTHEWVNFA